MVYGSKLRASMKLECLLHAPHSVAAVPGVAACAAALMVGDALPDRSADAPLARSECPVLRRAFARTRNLQTVNSKTEAVFVNSLDCNSCILVPNTMPQTQRPKPSRSVGDSTPFTCIKCRTFSGSTFAPLLPSLNVNFRFP